MKVITEEDLIARRNKLLKQGKNIAACMVDELIHECKEIDTLTVSRLRPHDEAMEDDEVLVKVRGESKLKAASVFEGKFIDIFCDQIQKETIEGIVLMPTYKPEKE